MRRVLIFLTLCLATFAFALRAPTHHSLRAEAMGNAHVAVVDDKEAIYFNYAGLTQINKLGNYDKYPETGYYPRNYGDMRLNLGGAGPFETYFHTYNVAKDLQRIYQGASNAAAATGQKASSVLMDLPGAISNTVLFFHALCSISIVSSSPFLLTRQMQDFVWSIILSLWIFVSFKLRFDILQYI